MDADIVAFTTAARNETRVQWDEETFTSHANEDAAVEDARQYLHGLKSELHADRLILCLSCPTRHYFRTDIYPEYKAHRTAGFKPLALDAVKKFFRESGEFESKTKPHLEADDVCGILATHPTLIAGEKVVVSADKDLRQIPSSHFNPRKPSEGVFSITLAQGDEWFYTQALTGDPTDGFPGCPRIGPVKAKKILGEASDFAADCWINEGVDHHHAYAWLAIKNAYAKAGKDEAYALTQARVARILRASDYDFDNQRPILWNPVFAPR